MAKSTLHTSLLFLLLTTSLLTTGIHILRAAQVQATHDVAVVKIAPSSTFARLGDSVDIAVTVENQGTTPENFTVTLSYDATPIEIKSVTNLQPDLNTTLLFAWNTTGLDGAIYATVEKQKTYTVKASASTVTGETDTQDNELSSTTPIRVVMQYIAVVPQRTVDPSITPGMNYTVSIYTDYNGTNIWSWQFSLSYNPVVLEGVEARNGELITTAKHSSAKFIAGTFDNTEGELSLTAAYFDYTTPPPFTVSGPGIMAYVTFRVKTTGESNITLTELETKLLAPGVSPQNEIINDYTPWFDHILYGSFRNKPPEAEITHDIALISVTPSPLSVVVGELVTVAVVVENQGTEAEIFDVKLYYDYNSQFPGSNVIGQRTAQSLAANADTTLTFTWNTTGAKAKDYLLTAVVPGIPGETDRTDNEVQSAQRVTVEAKELQPLPVTEIIIGLVIVLAVIIGVVLLLRRRKKPLPE